MGICIEVTVKVLLKNHCYKFCGKIFRQFGGSPSGFSVSGGGASVRIANWERQVVNILVWNGIALDDFMGYVEDMRLFLFQKGLSVLLRLQHLQTAT